jgi:hypothetical protein
MDQAVSLTELADSILQRTRDGKLSWAELSQTSYVATIGEDSIIIERRTPSLYTLRFVNKQGTEIDKIMPDRPSEENKMLEEIYSLARRQALRVDQTLLNIKQMLDRL